DVTRLSTGDAAAIRGAAVPALRWRSMRATGGAGTKGVAMTAYKLATYQTPAGPRAGLVVGDQLFDAAGLTRNKAYHSVTAILDDWRRAEGALRKAAASAAKSKAGK